MTIMKMLTGCLTTVILLVGSAREIQADYCPPAINAQIQECVQPVGEYAKLLNNNQDPKTPSKAAEFGGAFALPNMGRRVFNDLCKLVGKFNVCVKDLRSRCPRHVTIGLIDSSYGYLCNEGYNTFMESAECLMDLDRKPAVKSCHDNTLSRIEHANTESGITLNDKVERMCTALNYFSGCVKTPIKNDCGSPAWQVIYRVLKDTTKTLMPGCVFSNSAQRQILEGSEASSHHKHHGEGKRRKSSTTSPYSSTTMTTILPATMDFIVGTAENEDGILEAHRYTGVVATDATSDFYQLSSHSPGTLLSITLLCWLLVR